MAMKHLGETFDLHGGGKDLMFPHHENEIAQSEAYTGKEFVRCWIHHGFVTVDQEKMSKSLGNFFTIKEIFEKSPHFSEEIIAEVVRFYLLSTHYRSPIDFSDHSLKEAKSSLDNFYTLFQKVEELGSTSESSSVSNRLQEFQERFERVMDDDFNTAKAISVLQKLRGKVNAQLADGRTQWGIQTKDKIKSLGKILGLFQLPVERWSFKPWETDLSVDPTLSEEMIQGLIREREEARQKKEWAKSDQIRDRLAKAGVVIEDRPDGTTRVKR
jgi:cysteinyl-tRNA synthetase